MDSTTGFGATVLGSLSIAIGVIAVKKSYASGADAQDIAAARLLVAAPFVALVLLLFMRQAMSTAGLTAVLIAIAMGALIWFSIRAELEGLARLPAGTLVVLLSTTPVWVALIKKLVGGISPRRSEILAMVTVIGGLAVMVAPVGSSVNLVGALGGLLSAIAFAVFLSILDWNDRVSASLAFPLAILGAALIVIVTDPQALPGLSENINLNVVVVLGLSVAGWAVLVGLGVNSTGATSAAIVLNVEPLMVAGLAYLVLGEVLSEREFIGGTIILGALLCYVIGVARRGAGGPEPL